MTSRTAFTPGEWGQLRHLIQRWPDLRALTVRQPWADLIMAGVKDVENRSWAVPSTLPPWMRCDRCGRRSRDGVPEAIPVTKDGRRGTSIHWHDVCVPAANSVGELVPDGPFPFRLGIHAGQAWDDAWRLTPGGAAEHPKLGVHRTYPGGRFAGEGLLLGTVEVTGCHYSDDCPVWMVGHDDDGWPTAFCSRWADPDVYHWTLANPQPLPEPIPLRGRQGLWRLDTAVAA